MKDKVMWVILAVIFVSWVVGVYLKANGLWAGF